MPFITYSLHIITARLISLLFSIFTHCLMIMSVIFLYHLLNITKSASLYKERSEPSKSCKEGIIYFKKLNLEWGSEGKTMLGVVQINWMEKELNTQEHISNKK
jgi:hypothetical protein